MSTVQLDTNEELMEDDGSLNFASFELESHEPLDQALRVTNVLDDHPMEALEPDQSTSENQNPPIEKGSTQ